MSKFAKKIQAAALSLAIILQLAVSSCPASADDETEERTFVVTAYYSPVPNQKRYLRWSYEADIRLNGNGTHWASGRPVYQGMLAAPKNYEFWTSIHLEGLGTGTVDDRGGAIVKAGERGYQHDRIDVWMGYGDDGLSRALSWGKRTVKWRIAKGTTVEEQSVSIELASIPKAPIPAVVKKSAEDRIWFEPIGAKSSTEMIGELSEKLHEVGYLPAGKRETYDAEVKLALIRFQNDQGLLKGPKDTNAGYFGPATRKALKAAYEAKTEEIAEVSTELSSLSSELIEKIAEVSKRTQDLKASLEAVGTPKENETWSHVRVLQEALVSLGYLDAKPTGIYGPKTRDAVASFQLDNGLILSKSDPNAGKFGKITRSKMVISLAEKEVE